MKPDEVLGLYDADYAASYEAKFLTSENTAKDAAFELDLLGAMLSAEVEWLDVACGTGYFLSRFPEHRRAGADLSPAMLERAQRQNPGVRLVQHDFRDPRSEWDGRFGLVSCMWYAYALVDTIAEVMKTIENLASWTSESGICFVPIADPRMISRRNLPYTVEDNFLGRATITGILWSFAEDNGAKVHAHLVTPQVEVMVEAFERFFEKVEIIRYPPMAEGLIGRPALVASCKK